MEPLQTGTAAVLRHEETGIAGMTAVELGDNPVTEPGRPGHGPIVCIAKTAPRSCELILPQSMAHEIRNGPCWAATGRILRIPGRHSQGCADQVVSDKSQPQKRWSNHKSSSNTPATNNGQYCWPPGYILLCWLHSVSEPSINLDSRNESKTMLEHNPVRMP